MSSLPQSSKAQFHGQLESALNEKFKPAEAQAIARFSELLFTHLPPEELDERRFSDSYGALLGAWHFMQQGPGEEPKLRVFNPDLGSDGWQSTHTVLYVLHRDMPFLIDSIRIAINQRSIGIHTLYYSVVATERDDQGNLQSLAEASRTKRDEAMIVLEVDRHSDNSELKALEQVIQEVLHEVRMAVADFSAMKQKATEIRDQLSAPRGNVSEECREEARDLINWLIDDHFTFLGYDEYDFVRNGKSVSVERVEGSELGILRVNNERPAKVRLSVLPKRTRSEMTQTDQLFIFAKSAQRSRVHRPAYPDYIAVKKFNDDGEVIGERRFLGLYTARAYDERPDEIPLLRQKVEEVRKQSNFLPNDYAGKELDQILTLYPRDELFQIGAEELAQIATDILYIQERRQIRLFLREDVYGQFVTCLAFFPRDIYTTELRLKVESVLRDYLQAEDIEFVTHFSESVLARVQFTVRVPRVENRQLPADEIERRVVDLAQSWQDGLAEALNEHYGEEAASNLLRRYDRAMPASYRDKFSTQQAALDLDYVLRCLDTGQPAMSFYRALEEQESSVHLKLFNPEHQIVLSDVMPIFDNLGFRVLGEHPFEIIDREGTRVWIHDFSLQARHGEAVDLKRLRPIFEELFAMVWSGQGENDAFNRLMLSGYMDHRSINLLRAFARYMRQIRISNSQTFIANTLVNHVSLARQLLEFFQLRFDPAGEQDNDERQRQQDALEKTFLSGLDSVSNLSEDRVLRLYLQLMKSTLRTNNYQPDEAGHPKPYVSFKLNPKTIPDMPLPLPMFEIFVYSAQVEGVHLRGGKVARGGLRWSDRFEDYRTEILGLVKAQQVKNAVIVPVGAKGGFVAKRLPDGSDREAFQNAGIAAYKTFIRGLLDVTDNLKEGAIVPPRQVVRHDPDDHYLVVAADKGTATFSDIANSLSAEYDFWMGDAFASGGSQGYDHKKMGITARGAWVCVERHFRELGINPAEDAFTAIGIGDMAGDVFGNGLLRSDKTRLVAAFNHLHIFIDPEPDAEASFAERERLFNLPRSSWADYDPKLISKGGGVFNRSAKAIPISEPIQKLLGIKDSQLPPNDLIQAILKAEVDLLWVGGIGTYVKSSAESHADVGDKSNDGLRINGSELGCKIVGEGGNLGLTQLGRIEFALQGGRLNTDFIDNAGGVDCSDHEVNIKILLNQVVSAGDLTEKQRNQLLEAMTEEVAELVLMNNYRQTQALSIAQKSVLSRMEEYRRLMARLEAAGKLNRSLEFLPDEEKLAERKQRREGLTRPELAVLISYVKNELKLGLLDSRLPDEPVLVSEMDKIFPSALVKKFPDELHSHQLKREIIATQVANEMVNHMGISFVDRLAQSTGAKPSDIGLAWVITRDIYRFDHWWESIEALDYKVPAELQQTMMKQLMRLMRRSVRWLLRHRRGEMDKSAMLKRYQQGVQTLLCDLSAFLSDRTREQWTKKFEELTGQGVPEELAKMSAAIPYLYPALGIVESQQSSDAELTEVCETFFDLADRLNLDWFATTINDLEPSSHWEALARESFREDLDWQQRLLTSSVLRYEAADPQKRLETWLKRNKPLVDRWQGMLAELRAAREPEYAMFSVALRDLLDLAQSSQ